MQNIGIKPFGILKGLQRFKKIPVVRQEGRDEILAQIMPELQRCRRQVEHCHQHHEQLPPMPQLTPRPNFL